MFSSNKLRDKLWDKLGFFGNKLGFFGNKLRATLWDKNS